MKPTPASEWKRAREEGVVLMLSSGRAVRLRPVQLDRMLVRGEIPDLLTPVVAGLLWEGDEPLKDRSVEAIKRYVELMDIIIPAALVEPKVCLDGQPAEDEIRLDDLELSERLEILQLALQSTETLKRFSQRQEKSLEALPSSENAGPTSEQTAEY